MPGGYVGTVAERSSDSRRRAALAAAAHDAGFDVDFGSRRRAEYSADASNYRHVPLAVGFPRDAEQVTRAVAICREHAVPVTLRGGGTSVAGNAIGEGLVLDCSRYFNRILALDPHARTARVEPGVVLDRLQAAAAPHGLRFGPDPSTASRCTLGGMIGNNACGARSLAFGTTADNVLSLDLLLPDGTRTTARRGTSGVAELDQRLRTLAERHAGVIRRELGRFPRQASGYALQHLLPENGFDVARALAGSEGTLAAVLGAELRLVPLLRDRVLLVAAYPDMVAAAADVPRALPHQPSAIEGLGAELVRVWAARRRSAVPATLPEAGGWLFIETTPDRAAGLVGDLEGAAETRLVVGEAEQRALWRIREDGAGLATRTPDGAEAWPGFEDAAVPPERLASYLRDFEALMRRSGRRGTVFGHFGEGCLHVRIDHDLQTAAGRERFAEFTAAATALVVEHGGSVSGEHGDGQARSGLLKAMYSPEMLAAFEEFKAAFDPSALLNPAVLVAPRAFDADLRAPGVVQDAPPTLVLAADDGDFSRAVRRCVGVGKCRSMSGGVMCPSYRATGDERDSTRGRARVLQEMLDGRTVTQGYQAPEVLDVLDLCLGCKGCKTDCPVGVDMAAYKSEFLYQHYRGRVRPAVHYSLGWLPVWARLAAFAPRVVNRAMASPLAPVLKRVGGIAAERALPRFAARSFRRQVTRGRVVRPAEASPTESVVLWADTFTENFTPAVGQALVAVLRAAGFRVLLPPRTGCCGLTWISTGQLGVARRVLERTLELMRPAVEAGLPIVVPEPSCAAALREELTELLPTHPLAATAAALVTGPAEFLAARAPDWTPPASPWTGTEALVQIHCHQYASGHTGQAELDLLARAGLHATLISGCCGLAGDFGVTAGHYDVSMAIAEQNLLPAVRAATPDTVVIADGFSCRTQLEQAVAGRRVWHVAEVLAAGLGAGFGGAESREPTDQA